MSWRQGQAYSQDLRDRVLAAQGSTTDVARRFGVSASYVCRARCRLAQQGQATPGQQGNHVRARLADLHEQLRQQVHERPDQTLAQLCQWASQRHGVQVGTTTMFKTLRRLGLTFKKRQYMPPSKSEPT